MIDFLVKTFVRNHEQTDSEEVRTAYANFANWTGIIINFLLAILKLVLGLVINSLATITDSINNLTDTFSNIVNLIAFRIAKKPADEDHPYGHGRSEYIAGLILSLAVLLLGWEFYTSGLSRIFNPITPDYGWASIIILFATIVIKAYLGYFYTRINKVVNSGTLKAAATDSVADVLLTSGVLLSAVITAFANINIDGYVTLAISIFIFYSGIELFKDTISPILGRAPEPEEVEAIQMKIYSYPEVLAVHDLMLHDYGPNRKYASVHIEMPNYLSAIEIHDLVTDIENDFKEENIHMTIHADPVDTADDGNLRQVIIELLGEEVNAHGIHYRENNTCEFINANLVNRAEINLSDDSTIKIDLVFPEDCELTEDEFIDEVREKLINEFGGINYIINVDSGIAPISRG